MSTIYIDLTKAFNQGRLRRVAGGRKNPRLAYRQFAGRTLDPDVVKATVAEAFGATIKDLTRRRRNVWDRAVAARCLVRYSGLTQRDVANELSMGTGGAVSLQLRKLDNALETNHRLRRQVKDWDEVMSRLDVNY